VIESGPDGFVIRDSGSANGIFVNGKKVERSSLGEGDVIKMGDVVVRVLGAAASGTIVLPELDEAGPPPVGSDLPTVLPGEGVAPLSDSAPLDPVDAAELLPSAGAAGRPLFVRTLVILWGLSVPAVVIGGFAVGWSATGASRAGVVVVTLLLAGLGVALAYGLWLGRPWARGVQIGAAAFALFVCPFTLAAIAILVYLLRPEGRRYFSTPQAREAPDEKNEVLFTGALLGAVVLGLLLTAAATFFARTARTRVREGAGPRLRPSSAEMAAADQLRTLAAAEEAFHGVCNTGYGDLAALRRPATVIQNYPAGGPAFLRDDAFDRAERDGYRFSLRVEDEMPLSPGCPVPRYRRFQFFADPRAGAGRHLMIAPDGVIRAAEERAATLEDPPAY
jgi:hypothetical protein